MRLSLKIAFLGLFLWSSCQNEPSPTTEDGKPPIAKQDSTEQTNQEPENLKILEGEIAGKYPIQMQLIIEDQAVRGCYFYKKHELLLPLKGALRDDNRLELSVYDVTQEVTELFMGQIAEDGKTYTGQWFKVDAGAERFDFTLQKTTLQHKTDWTTLTGTYEYTVQGFTNYLILEAQNPYTVKFQLVTSFASCTGEVDGQAYFYDDNHINFYGEEDCYINFFVENGTVTVTELVCTYYHGFRCSFDGKYKKVSDETKWIKDI